MFRIQLVTSAKPEYLEPSLCSWLRSLFPRPYKAESHDRVKLPE